MPTTLTDQEKVTGRNRVEKEFATQNWDKTEINAALDALDEIYEDQWKAEGVAAINTATSPFVFSNAQKKKIAKHWFFLKFVKE